MILLMYLINGWLIEKKSANQRCSNGGRTVCASFRRFFFLKEKK